MTPFNLTRPRPSMSQGRRRALAVTAVMGLLIGATIAGGAPSAVAQVAIVTSAAGAAPAASPDCPTQEATGDLVKGRHTVVVVHGWTGTPLRSTRTNLANELGKGWQIKLFDYSGVAGHWAARPEIAQCLARYLMTVSKAVGDGKVYVVAHSMGGLATAFAADPTYGATQGLADRLGGLVTLDTPWTGSVWGDTFVAHAKDLLSRMGSLSRLSDPFSDGWKCLRPTTKDSHDPACPEPRALPRTVPVAQLGSSIKVSRSYFGLHAYDIYTGSDGIVSTDSQQNYLSRVSGSTIGMDVTAPSYNCTVSMDAVVASLPTTVFGGPLLGALSTMNLDSKAMDSLSTGTPSDALVAFVAGVLWTAPCSHINVTAQATAAQKAADELTRMANRPLLKITDALNAPVPADCQHPAGRLVNGEQKGPLGNPGLSYVWTKQYGWTRPPKLADLNGDGSPELISVLQCSAGGVSWPQRLLVYTPGPKLLGSISLSDVTPAEHSDVESLTPERGGLRVNWSSYEGASFDRRQWSALLRWDGSRLVLDQRQQLSGARAPGRAIMSGEGVTGFVTPSGNIACILVQSPGGDSSSAQCETVAGAGRLSPAPPPKPSSCPYEWGQRLTLNKATSGFACYNDAIAPSSSLGTDWTRWYDPAQDLSVTAAWGPSAAPRPHSLIESALVSCMVEQDSVSCRYGWDGPEFTLSPTHWSVSK